jgi:hypothetical protein
MSRKKKCCALKRYEAMLYLLGVLLILNSIPLFHMDLLSASLSLVAGLLLIPLTADRVTKMLPALCTPQMRFLIIGICILLLTSRTQPFNKQAEHSNTGLWSTVCLKDCDNDQGSRAAHILDEVRDCGVLRNAYDVTPGSVDRLQWVRMVRARARMLDCPNM